MGINTEGSIGHVRFHSLLPLELIWYLFDGYFETIENNNLDSCSNVSNAGFQRQSAASPPAEGGLRRALRIASVICL